MKTKLFSAAIAAMFGFTAQATVFTVSNVPNSIANFNNIAAAITAASPGDTIYVQPSGVGYGTVTVNKSVVLIGSGTWPEGQSGWRSTVSSFTLSVTAASGTVIRGFDITTANCITTSQAISNVVIENNRLINILFNNTANNIVIRNNLFASNWTGVIAGSSICTNILITNNIFRTTTTGGDILSLSNASNNGNLFANNIVRHEQATVNPIRNARNFTIVDNIIFGGASASGTDAIQNCNISHNLFFGNYTQAGVIHASSNGANNLFGTAFNPVFTETAQINSMWAYAPTAPFTNFSLPVGSPAIGSGSNGNNMGIYAGSFPWMDNPAGPARRYYPGNRIPEIYEFVSPGVAAPNSTMQIQIKARNAN